MRLGVALALGMMVAGVAQAAPPRSDWGYGPYVDGLSSVISPVEALDLPPLTDADGDVFRFSSAPALGGRGYVVTLTELPQGAGRIEARVVEGRPYLGWKVIAGVEALLTRERYAAARAALEKLYDPPSLDALQEPRPDEDLSICTDGPGYLSESRKGRELTFLKGFCGNHPNDAIARLMRELAAEAASGAWRTTADQR